MGCGWSGAVPRRRNAGHQPQPGQQSACGRGLHVSLAGIWGMSLRSRLVMNLFVLCCIPSTRYCGGKEHADLALRRSGQQHMDEGRR